MENHVLKMDLGITEVIEEEGLNLANMAYRTRSSSATPVEFVNPTSNTDAFFFEIHFYYFALIDA